MGKSHPDRHRDDRAAIVPMPDFAGTSAPTSAGRPMVAKHNGTGQRKISGGAPRRLARRRAPHEARPERVSDPGIWLRRG